MQFEMYVLYSTCNTFYFWFLPYFIFSSIVMLREKERVCGRVCVCACVYLSSCSKYTGPELHSCGPVCIYICSVFFSVDVHSLPLSPLSTVHSKYLYFFRENYFFFVFFKQIPFCNFSCVPSNI